VYYVLAASNQEVEREREREMETSVHTYTRCRHKSNVVTLYDNAVELGMINRCLIKYLDDPSFSCSLVSRRTHVLSAQTLDCFFSVSAEREFQPKVTQQI